MVSQIDSQAQCEITRIKGTNCNTAGAQCVGNVPKAAAKCMLKNIPSDKSVKFVDVRRFATTAPV
jgi:hypothetical protein